MSMENYDAILAHATTMARQAGEVQLKLFRSRELEIATKQNDFDVVTAADKASERLITDCISTLYPDHSILTEESGLILKGDDSWQWVIDPLDGTTNYSAGLPWFNVSIGVKHHGEAVVGVVYAAQLHEMFTAVKGKGAWLNGNRIAASETPSLAKAVVSTGFPYDKATNPDNNLDNVARIMPLVRGLRRLGSAALDISYVAAGFLDAYWEMNLNEWDVCAAMLIAHEAGAVARRFRPDRNWSIIAAGKVLAPQLEQLLAGH
ncbi:MAG: inositol monophosphatase [Muribaculaceae bacterium]|nr:inositol monophosphatase [Muribaculaceae bacterium]MBQ2562642.1 inositol monophosphatase [Muribaculaceae bacterium]MBQ5409267.1 inositol monophosphatase [Muribaculaceae bacterium]